MREGEQTPPGNHSAAPADPYAVPLPPQLVASWQRGESRLFQSVLWDPDSYRRSVELVGVVLGHLREAGAGTSPLIAAAGLGPALVERALGAAVEQTAGLDVSGIAEAALAMRQREVLGEQARSRRLQRLAAAQRRGQVWVTVEEAGDPSGDPLLPYRRLEVEVATGRGLLVSATADDTFTGCVHLVEQVRVDLASGAHSEPETEATYPTAEAREQGADAWRDASAHP
jgi:hypothetical protein